MKWLTKWTAPRGSASKTHALLDGGLLDVPPDKHGLFLNEYANAVARSEKVHVVEFLTPVFRLFVDLDFPGDTAEDIVDAAIKSGCGVASYYFDVESEACVLRKDVETPGKRGVHVVWKDVYVTTSTAVSFRNHLVSKLDDACPQVSWAQVVDGGVYRTSLRMPWSRKTESPGVYVPSQTCAPDGTFAAIDPPKTAAAIREWIRKTSVRAPDASPTTSCIVTSEPDTSSLASGSKQPVVPESLDKYADALSTLASALPSDYGPIRFASLHRFGDSAAVLRTSCRRCANKSYEEHASSTVYFVILKRGVVYQRCYCRKEVARQGGVTCADFVGTHLAAPKATIDALWPPPTPSMANMMRLFERTRPPLKKRRKKGA